MSKQGGSWLARLLGRGGPATPDECIARGIALARQARFEAALACFDQGLALEPGHAALCRSKAAMLQAM